MESAVDRARRCLLNYRHAVQELLIGVEGAREAVERARDAMASPTLIESLLAEIEALSPASACSCGSSVLPCALHGGVDIR
jgi:hypothetical protein